MQIAQCVIQVLQPARPRRRFQPRVQHITGQHLTVGGGRVEQRWQVVQPQIAPEPQQCGHAIDAAPNPR